MSVSDTSSVPAGVNPSPRPVRRTRWVWLAVLMVTSILGGLGYRHYWYARPIGSGPAGPSVPASAFERVWSERDVLLVGFGDSVTQSYGASPGHGYFERLVQNPADEFPDMQGIHLKRVLPNLRTLNVSLSGTTSPEHLEILVPKIPFQTLETYGIIVLTTGGNDVIHNYGRTPPREGAMYGATLQQAQPWIENFVHRLDAILDALEARFPGGCSFFLANIYDPTDGVGDAENAGLPRWPGGLEVLQAYNDVIAACTQRRSNVHLVDMRGTFLGHGVHCQQFWREHYDARDPYYWYFDNLEDPNDRGYDALRRIFLLKMVETLPDRFATDESLQNGINRPATRAPVQPALEE